MDANIPETPERTAIGLSNISLEDPFDLCLFGVLTVTLDRFILFSYHSAKASLSRHAVIMYPTCPAII
jgi:hypothetical protein